MGEGCDEQGWEQGRGGSEGCEEVGGGVMSRGGSSKVVWGGVVRCWELGLLGSV